MVHDIYEDLHHYLESQVPHFFKAIVAGFRGKVA